MIYRQAYFLVFPTTKICTRWYSKFGNKYFAGVYAPKAYSAILSFLGMLQHIYLESFPNCLNYKHNKNTYEYIVTLHTILYEHIEESYVEILFTE